MAQAVQAVLSKYATFSGRARRSEYWWFALAYLVAVVVTSFVDAAIGTQVVTSLLALALFLPSLAVTVRRLHDTNRSGWWILICVVPIIGSIALLVFACTEGTAGYNDHGPSPKSQPTYA